MVTDSDGSTSSSDAESSVEQHHKRPNATRRQQNKRGGRKARQRRNPHHNLTEEQQAQYVALDCEMVGVGDGGIQSALARVTLLNYQGQIVYDEFVRPSEPVTDYRTFVSGITEQDLAEQALDLQVVRQNVLELLEGRILIGHALKNDLTALGIHHPWFLTRDTAKYEPFLKMSYHGIPCARKLKDLAAEHLSREIQVPGMSHCPVQDALAALDLYKHVRVQWEKAMEYKIQKTRIMMEQSIYPTESQ